MILSEKLSQRWLGIPIWLWLLALVGLIARLGVTLFLSDNRTVYYEYMTIAQNILDGKGYVWDEWGRAPLQPTSFFTPVYILWCVFWMGLTPGNYVAMYIAQALVQCLGFVPAYLTGKSFFGDKVGGSFAGIYLLYPEFVYMHSRPATEWLYVPLCLWLLYGYAGIINDRMKTSRSRNLAIMMGLVGGVAVLTKEGAAILIACILLALFIEFRHELGVLLRRTWLPMGVAATIVLVPWIIRNYEAQGTFIPVRTGYWITAWIANHHGATGTDKRLNGEYVLATMDTTYLHEIDRRLPADEQARDSVYKVETLNFVKTHSLEYLQLTLTRLRYFLWFDETHPIARSRIYRLSYIFVLLFAIPGIVIAYRHYKVDRILWMAYVGYMVLYVPILVLPRYRIIPITILLLLAAVTVARLGTRFRLNRYN